MEKQLVSGLVAFDFYKIEILIYDDYHAKKNQRELWIEENCNGRFFIGPFYSRRFKTGDRVKEVSFFFELATDVMAFKLRWM